MNDDVWRERVRAKVASRRSVRQPLRLAAILVIVAVVATGCFTLIDNKNHGVGTETNRVNLVVYRKATNFLDDQVHRTSVSATRQLLVDVSPDKIRITTTQKALVCTLIGGLVCLLTLDELMDVVLSWFKDDVRNRSDFHEALHEAKDEAKCFTWTFAPSRNFTVKSNGTSGCKYGVLY